MLSFHACHITVHDNPIRLNMLRLYTQQTHLCLPHNCRTVYIQFPKIPHPCIQTSHRIIVSNLHLDDADSFICFVACEHVAHAYTTNPSLSLTKLLYIVLTFKLAIRSCQIPRSCFQCSQSSLGYIRFDPKQIATECLSS